MGSMIGAGEAAKMLGCERQHVDNFRKSGKLKGLKTNQNRWTYDRDEVAALAASRTPKKVKSGKQDAEQLGEQHAQQFAQQIKPLLDALKAPYESQIADLKADKDRLEKRVDELQKKLDDAASAWVEAGQGRWRWPWFFKKS